MNVDIGGFLASSEFLGQIATMIVQLFTAILGGLVSGLFGLV